MCLHGRRQLQEGFLNRQELGAIPQDLSPGLVPLRKEDACCRGEPPGIPWKAYFTKRGWKERWRRLLGGAKSVYTVAKCKRNLPDFDLKSFKSEAIKLYTDINSAVAVGDRTKLRHVSHFSPCVPPHSSAPFGLSLSARLAI